MAKNRSNKARGKPDKMTLREFRQQMSKHGMFRWAGKGPEQWEGDSRSMRWTVVISARRGTCRVTCRSRHGYGGYHDHGLLPYKDACDKIDFHGIFFNPD